MLKLGSPDKTIRAKTSRGTLRWLAILAVSASLLTAAFLSFWQYLQISRLSEQSLSTVIPLIEKPALNSLKSAGSNKLMAPQINLNDTLNIDGVIVYDSEGKYVNHYYAHQTPAQTNSPLPPALLKLINTPKQPATLFSELWQAVNHQGRTVKPFGSSGYTQVFVRDDGNRITAYSPLLDNQQLQGIFSVTLASSYPVDLLNIYLQNSAVLLLLVGFIILSSVWLTRKYNLTLRSDLTKRLTNAYEQKTPLPPNDTHGYEPLLTVFNQLIEDVNDKNRLLNFQPQILNVAAKDNILQLKELTEQNQHLQALSRQAIAAQQAAESANRVKSDFLATMSHELRTSMNALLGMAETISEPDLDESQRHSLQIMKQSSSILLNLINSMTDFSKIETGELALVKNEFNCIKLIQDNFQLLELEAKAKDLKYTLEQTFELPFLLLGDATRLSQILVNLLSNAIKFTAQGEIRLTVNAQKINANTLRLHCEITDTGIGIGASQLDALFDAFAKDDSAMTRIFPDAGIGLVITKQLVHLMQGKIGVHSQPGIGSTFWFWIDFEQSRTKIKQAKTPNNYRFNASLLVAEDYPANQLVVQRFLEDLGCRVQMVNNGFEAVKAVKKQHYDLIFMDCQMPFMDGYQATQEIRKIEVSTAAPGKRLPIIALTAHALNEDEIKCRLAGMDEWVTKPFTRHDLSKILLKWLPKELIVNDQPALRTDARTLAKASSVLDESHAINMKFFTRQFKLDNIDDIAFINALTNSFQENAAKTLSNLQYSIDNADAEGIKKQAHGLKSLSVNVGSGRLTELCTAMENAGKTKELAQVQELLDSMKQEYLRVLSELNSICAKA